MLYQFSLDFTLADQSWNDRLAHFNALLERRASLARLKREAILVEASSDLLDDAIQRYLDHTDDELAKCLEDVIGQKASSLDGLACKAFILLEFVSGGEDLGEAGAYSLSTDLIEYFRQEQGKDGKKEPPSTPSTRAISVVDKRHSG